MSENESKRASAMMTWYSVYQSQVVGQPSTLWSASEEDVTAKNMSNGFDDDDDALVKTNSEESTLDWNHSKDSHNWNHSKDSDDGKYSKDANDIKDEQQQTHNNKNFTVENGNSMNSSSSSQSLLRPLSMDVVGWMEQKKVKVEGEPGLQRSRSTIANWDDYEEFKLPKQYQKPTNTQINTRLSRTYITGAGNDKCKNCGQRLYEMEKINANHSSYHRTCFQCSRCQRLLSLSNFISMDGQLYCSSHFLDVVCNKTNIAETTQMSNGSDEKHDTQHQTDTQKISKDVTLASINDIKSRFESPSNNNNNNNNNNNQIESEMKSKDEHPKKIRPLAEDVSVKFIASSQDVQQVQHHPTSTFKHSASSSASSASRDNNVPFELNADTTRSRRLKDDDDDKEAFVVAAHQSSIASPMSPFTSNDDNYTLPVADAFAIFKTMENMSIERIPSSEIKPAKKMPLNLQLKTSAKDSLQENKEMGNHLSYFVTTQNANRDERLHAVSIHDAAMKEKSIAAAVEDDVPPVGITKQLVEQWKRMDVTDGSSLFPLHRSHAQVMSSSPSSISRRSTTDEMTHDVNGYSSKIITNNMTNDSLQLTSGLHVTGPATYGYENTLVGKHNEIVAQDTSRLLRKKGSQDMAAAPEPIDFTRNQLAKFKVLEAMAQKSTNHYPLSRKDFRWGVKEVSPLHRPIAQANQTPPAAAAAVQIGLKRDDSMLPPAVVIHNPFFADQTDAWDGWKKTDYDHRANLSANHNQTNAWNGLKTDYDDRHANPNLTHIAAFADQRNDAIEEEPILLACMKEALAQFKSMEDLTRPPPNPVIALSKQRQAIATHTKQYHDVIHVSYATQTARD